jgi:REP element-mobilizing transposase RayT
MPNTYQQIYIHIVFAVKFRENLIAPVNREELHKYITGIVTNKGQKMLAVFCMPDHAHIFISMNPNVSISDIVRDIKANSSRFINEQGWVKGKFRWQEGFGAFSHSKSNVPVVADYVMNQEAHHAKMKFKNEFIDLLNEHGVEYDERYLFDWID